MHRFRFQQEPLLNVKRQLHRQAEIRVQHAQSQLDSARQRLASLEQDLVRMAKHVSVDMPAPADAQAETASTWRWVNAAQSVQSQFRTAQQMVQAAQRSKDECATKLRDLEAEVESLESLRRRQWDAYRRDVGHQHDLLLDDVALRQWMLPRDAATGGEPS